MKTILGRRFGRAVAAIAIAFSVSAAAAGMFATPAHAYGCGANNPSCGCPQDSPQCSGDGGGSTNGVGGPSYPNPDVGAGQTVSWGAPWWSGTFQMQTFGGLYRGGVFATTPNIQFSTTLVSSSPFGFHGCVDVKALDSRGGVVYDSTTLKAGVSGWSTVSFTFGPHLDVATAASISSFTVAQWQC